MKTLKLITATTIAFGLASMASAALTVINVSGSTAFRTAAVNAEIAHLSNVGTNLPGGVAMGAYTTGSLTGGTVSIVYGYDSAGNEILYRNHWTGSAAGVYDLAHGTSLSFLPSSTTVSVAPGTAAGAGTDTDSGTSDIAFTDVQAADVSASVATAIGGAAFAAEIDGAGLLNCGTGANAGKGVAVVLFKWVLGNSAISPANWAVMNYNMTQQAAASLISNGFVSLANITGNSADATSYLIFIGRNEDSGTRVCYEAESLGGGTLGNANAFGASVNQYMVQTDTTAYATGPYNGTGSDTNVYPTVTVGTTVQKFKLWPRLQAFPANTGWQMSTNLNFTWKTIGHSGYNGGGDVAGILRTSNPVAIGSLVGSANVPPGATKIYIVSLLGAKDAGDVIGAGGKECYYNGVQYTLANVEEGAYTPWTFEHMYHKPSLAGTALTGADGLANDVAATPTGTLQPVGLNLADLLNGLGRGQAAGGRVP
jgi:hypothetical protein